MSPIPLLRAPVAGAVLFAAGLLAGAALLPVIGVQANPVGIPAGASGPDAAGPSGPLLLVQAATLETLEKRVEKLEKAGEEIDAEDLAMQEVERRLDELEGNIDLLEVIRGYLGAEGTELDSPPAEGGLVLRAPFTIVGSNGQPILSASEEGGALQLVVGDPAGENKVALKAGTGGESAVEVGAERVLAKLAAGGSKAYLSTTSGEGGAALGTSEFGWGLFLNTAGGDPAAEIAQPEGKGMALRVYEGGRNVASVGSVPGGGGAVRVFAPGAPKAAAALNAMSDGSGMVEAWTAGGELAAALDGKERAVTAYGPDGIATLGKSDAGFGLFLKNRSGGALADLSQPSGRGMALRVYENGNEVAALGQVPGEGGSVRIFSPGGSNAAVTLRTNDDGSGKVHVWGSGGQEAVLLDGEKREVTVHSGDKVAVRAGTGGSGEGTVTAYLSSGKPGAVLAVGGESGAGTVLLFDSGGGEALTLGGKYHALRVIESGQERVVVGKDGADMGLHMKSHGSTSIAIASYAGRPDALRAFSSGTVVASFGAKDGYGLVNVGDGSQVFASMAAGPGGGGHYAFDASSIARAAVTTLDSPGEGVVVVRNSSGTSVAYLTASSSGEGGNVTVTDPSGVGVFSAGAASDGGGEACVNRGDKGLWCMGVNLPLTIQ